MHCCCWWWWTKKRRLSFDVKMFFLVTKKNSIIIIMMDNNNNSSDDDYAEYSQSRSVVAVVIMRQNQTKSLHIITSSLSTVPQLSIYSTISDSRFSQEFTFIAMYSIEILYNKSETNRYATACALIRVVLCVLVLFIFLSTRKSNLWIDFMMIVASMLNEGKKGTHAMVLTCCFAFCIFS
jgi:hypothetical protein